MCIVLKIGESEMSGIVSKLYALVIDKELILLPLYSIVCFMYLLSIHRKVRSQKRYLRSKYAYKKINFFNVFLRTKKVVHICGAFHRQMLFYKDCFLNQINVKNKIVRVFKIFFITGIIVFELIYMEYNSNDNNFNYSIFPFSYYNKIIATEINYDSDLPKSNCILCGDNSINPINLYWGQKNFGIVNLNTFECKLIEINRYDDNKQLIKEEAGYLTRTSFSNKEDGIIIYITTNSDRGYANIDITLDQSSLLNIEKMKEYLCTDCIKDFMSEFFETDSHLNVALLNFENRTLIPIRESLKGQCKDDYYFRYYFDKNRKGKEIIDITIFYCPSRFK